PAVVPRCDEHHSRRVVTSVGPSTPNSREHRGLRLRTSFSSPPRSGSRRHDPCERSTGGHAWHNCHLRSSCSGNLTGAACVAVRETDEEADGRPGVHESVAARVPDVRARGLRGRGGTLPSKARSYTTTGHPTP